MESVGEGEWRLWVRGVERVSEGEWRVCVRGSGECG